MKKEVKPIRREKYKGKYYVVLREKGKVIERIRWSSRPGTKKGNYTTTKQAITNYKSNRSIFENRKRTTGDEWKFIEETRSVPSNYLRLKESKHPSILRKRNTRYQYTIEGVIYRKSGKVDWVVASSQQHDADYPVDKARQEAIESFFERAHYIYRGSVEGNYDANEGRKLVDEGKIEVKRESIKHYVEK